jgi:hypothetical protein
LQLQKLFAHSRAPWPSSSRHKHPLSLHHQDRSGIGWWDKITETSSSPSPSPARLDTLLPSYHPTIRAQGALGSLFKHFKHISSPLRETDWGDHRHFTFAENLGHDITRSATRQADRPNITRSLTIISRARKPHNTTPVRQGPKSRLTTFELKFWQLFDTYTILQSNTAEAQRSAQNSIRARVPQRRSATTFIDTEQPAKQLLPLQHDHEHATTSNPSFCNRSPATSPFHRLRPLIT